MKKFFEDFASICQRIEGVMADIELIRCPLDAIIREHDKLLKANDDNFIPGVYLVPGGAVVIPKLKDVDIAYFRQTVKTSLACSFAIDFAILSQRKDSIQSDLERAVNLLERCSEERDTLLINVANKLKIGVHPVPGGYVVVSRTAQSGLEVTYYEDIH